MADKTKKAPTADARTLALIEAVRRQKEEIANAERPNWKTNQTFTFVEGQLNNAIALHIEKDVRKLAMIAGFLVEKEEQLKKGAEVLGIETPELIWNGYSFQDWFDDLKARTAKIQITQRREKLAKLESRLNAVMTPELRQQLELEAIERELA